MGSSARVVVVGGGISGLAAAHSIAESMPGVDLRLLEAEPTAGGKVCSLLDPPGWLVEAGPNGFLDNAPATLDLARRVGLGDRLVRASPSAAHRFVFLRGALRQVPDGPGSLLRSDLLSFGGKLRLLAEPLLPGRPPGAPEESVLAFARRRFGAEAAGFLAGPMVAGIYAGDAAELSMEAAFPRIAALESAHGSVVRGALAAMLQRRRERATSEGRSHDARPAPTGGAAPGAGGAASFGGRLTSFPLGLAELCARLAGRLEKVVRTDAPVRRLARDGTRWAVELDSGEVEPADVVVLAVPPDGAARLVAGLGGAAGAALGTALAGIPLAPVVVVALGFERAAVRHPLDGFGFLVPPGEGPRSLGVLFASSVFPGQAPAGKVLLRAIVGGARDPTAVTLDDELLVRAVREDLRATLGLTAEPVYRRIVRWPAGIPQYNLGHVQRVSAADRAGETLGGLVLGGNALRGVAFNACVENGASVAASVGRLLARTVVDARG